MGTFSPQHHPAQRRYSRLPRGQCNQPGSSTELCDCPFARRVDKGGRRMDRVGHPMVRGGRIGTPAGRLGAAAAHARFGRLGHVQPSTGLILL